MKVIVVKYACDLRHRNLCRILRHRLRCRIHELRHRYRYRCKFRTYYTLHRVSHHKFNHVCSPSLASRRLLLVSAPLVLLSSILLCRILSESATDMLRGNERPYRHIHRFRSYSLLPVPLSGLVSAMAPPNWDVLKR